MVNGSDLTYVAMYSSEPMPGWLNRGEPSSEHLVFENFA